MATRREQILREMGLAPLWRRRAAKPAKVVDEQPSPGRPKTVAHPPGGLPRSGGDTYEGAAPAAPQRGGDDREARIAAMEWPALQEAVAACRACRLCESRKQAVLGVGDREADWLFVGEGPGAEEDERGEPFVGQAGKLLDNMLAAIGLKRGRNVYIANVVKCRPPDNRTPEPEETAACFPFLQRQIELLQPRLIVALGRPAAQTLLAAEVKIAQARGRLFDFRGIPLIVTYHPAYLLRNLPDKAKAWEDLCLARRTMRGLTEGGETG